MRNQALYKLIFKKKKIKRDKKEIARPVKVFVPYEVLSTEEKFLASFIKKENGCWEWNGKLDRYGYGVFKANSKSYKAHRYSYQQFKGSFDSSLHVLHKCDNPKCVNPDHLFLGTNQDNIKDKVDKGRSKFHCKQLTNDEKKNILSLLEKHLPKKQIAESFNVHISTVSRLQQKQNRV